MISVARHGQTDYNLQGLICGRADAALTAEGKKQAQQLAAKVKALEIPVTAIISSPLRRAYDTAAIVRDACLVPLSIDSRLSEMDFGVYDGQPIETPIFQLLRQEFSLPFPKGESLLDVAGRVYPLLQELVRDETSHYLLVCHNALSRMIDNYFNGKPMAEFLAYNLANTQLVTYGRMQGI